tara:strand:+ start:1844 stop:2020 length:177 start_codon:yes stop_codon:yes gene_type:complete
MLSTVTPKCVLRAEAVNAVMELTTELVICAVKVMMVVCTTTLPAVAVTLMSDTSTPVS